MCRQIAPFSRLQSSLDNPRIAPSVRAERGPERFEVVLTIPSFGIKKGVEAQPGAAIKEFALTTGKTPTGV
jgi:hypothetical protein